uniref:Uncharacterized protein n=1 Tax=Romanomermis culicivorax TaxID=13658 RepID=A0A915KUT7_ROMCU
MDKQTPPPKFWDFSDPKIVQALTRDPICYESGQRPLTRPVYRLEVFSDQKRWVPMASADFSHMIYNKVTSEKQYSNEESI